MRRAGALLAVSLLAVAALPLATAHSVEQPLPVETQLLQDDGHDEFYWYDGYDLWTLFVREAHLIEDRSSGLVLRFGLYGGFGPPDLAETLHVEIGLDGPDGARTFRLSTSDDETWTGDLRIRDVNVTREDPPWTGVTTSIQAFAPYEAFGAEPGDALSGFRMLSLADDDPRDVAPGGIYVPHSQGMAEIPAHNGEGGDEHYLSSRRLVENLTLQGPVGYVEHAVTVDGWNVTVDVANPFEDQGQHVTVGTGQTPGWEVSVRGRPAKLLEPAGNATFEMTARPTPNATEPLPVVLTTDIGGREVLYLGSEGGEIVPGDGPDATVDPLEAPPPASTPGPGLAVAVLAVLAGAWWRRNRRPGP